MLILAKLADLWVNQTALHAQLVFFVPAWKSFRTLRTIFALSVEADSAEIKVFTFHLGLVSTAVAKALLPVIVYSFDFIFSVIVHLPTKLA